MTDGVTYTSIGVYTEWNVRIEIEPGSAPDYRNRYGDGLRPAGLRIRVRRYPDARLPSFPGAAADEAGPDDIEVTLLGIRLKKDSTPGKRPGQEWFLHPELDDPQDELPDWAAEITRTVLRDIAADGEPPS